MFFRLAKSRVTEFNLHCLPNFQFLKNYHLLAFHKTFFFINLFIFIVFYNVEASCSQIDISCADITP